MSDDMLCDGVTIKHTDADNVLECEHFMSDDVIYIRAMTYPGGCRSMYFLSTTSVDVKLEMYRRKISYNA